MQDKMKIDRIDEILREVFRELKARGGSARGTEVLEAIAPRLKLSSYELATTKTGSVRWDTHVRFYTTDCTRAGFLTKSSGVWTLTSAGEEALKLPSGQLVRTAMKMYRQAKDTENGSAEEVPDDSKVQRRAAYEKAKESAIAEIEEQINNITPYDFQNLVAELLKAMGYHVPYVAPPGPDGGVDIVAYRDPLGTLAPRIRVQVKHREQKVGAREVRELEGLLRRDGDMGLIVSSGGFTSEGEREIRSSTKHIETMDQERLIKLWQEHYDKIDQRGKIMLPLVPVYFLAPDEE